MTFLEKVKKDNPNIKLKDSGAPMACPFELGYEEDYDCEEVTCINCWNREMPGTEPNVVNVGELMDRTYEQGLNDAWELVRKIFRTDCADLQKVFGHSDEGVVIMTFDVQEAIAKLKEYEDRKIEVGDVVVLDDEEYVVTRVNKTPPTITISGLNAKGEAICWSDNDYTKTGKHIDIQEILKQIGE